MGLCFVWDGLSVPSDSCNLTHWGRDKMAAFFADDTSKCIFLKENVRISIKISLKFVPKSPIDNIQALFQIRAWRRPGDKPLPEAMMVSLLTHICVAWPQWVIYTHTSGLFAGTLANSPVVSYPGGIFERFLTTTTYNTQHTTVRMIRWMYCRSLQPTSIFGTKGQWYEKRFRFLWPLLLIWFNFNPGMDK